MIAFMSLGGGEMLIILLIILLLFGAKRLPDLARSLAQAKKEFQNATREASQGVEAAVKSAGPVSANSTLDSVKKP